MIIGDLPKSFPAARQPLRDLAGGTRPPPKDWLPLESVVGFDIDASGRFLLASVRLWQGSVFASSLMPGGAAQTGESWSFQCWYRYANPNVTTNFSSTLEVFLR